MEIAEKRKAAAARRAAAIKEARKLRWLNKDLLPEFEKKLLDVFDKQLRLCGGENDGVILSLCDYELVFFVDKNLCTIGRLDSVTCRHAIKVSVEVEYGKLTSYRITGNEPYQFFTKILPDSNIVKKD